MAVPKSLAADARGALDDFGGVNALEFPKVAALLTSLVKQAQGSAPLTPVNATQFVSVAQLALQQGYDPVINSISQLFSKTIFSVRPYYRKFLGLYADEIAYGNHVRKLTAVDTPVQDDTTLGVCGADADVDMYKGCCPEVLQLNFYGQVKYQKCLKIFKNQLNTAFSGPAEFQQFISMELQNLSNYMEQTQEEAARMTLSNLMAGIYTIGGRQVIHLLTEYNAYAGTTFTAQTVRQPDNFPGFVRWMYARINTLSDHLTNRTQLYHQNVAGKEVARHTPKNLQHLYILDEFINQADSLVLSNTYQAGFMRLPNFEKVSYWQSIENPGSINVTPVYMDTSGSLVTPSAPVQLENIVGVVFDRDAAGYTLVDTWSAPTPFNAKGGFAVNWYHWTDRFWNDFTENAVLLVLD